MSLDIFGDRWSLLIVRDLLFKGRKTYQEFMASGEDIATNILADRLAHLEKSGIITWERDALDGRRINYGLTPKGLALAPVLVEMIIWAAEFESTAAPEHEVRAMKRDRARFIRRAVSASGGSKNAPPRQVRAPRRAAGRRQAE